MPYTSQLIKSGQNNTGIITMMITSIIVLNHDLFSSYEDYTTYSEKPLVSVAVAINK